MADQLNELQRHAKRTGEIIADLTARYPDLNYITAHVMASDLYSAEKAYASVLDGSITAAKSLVWVGSYARWDYAIRLMREGLLPKEAFFADIAHLWSGSDPDDTEPSYLALWQEAKEHNGGRRIRQEGSKPLRAGEFLTVYRGGPNDPALWQGIAWTLKQDTARMFAQGAGQRVFDPTGIVITGKVRRGSILAYITSRHEEEVIVPAMAVRNVKEVR